MNALALMGSAPRAVLRHGQEVAMLHDLPPGAVFTLWVGGEEHVQPEVPYHHNRPVLVVRWPEATS